jgi:hypothetical protein
MNFGLFIYKMKIFPDVSGSVGEVYENVQINVVSKG